MKRREFLTVLATAAALGSPALAQDYVDRVVRQLRAQGFRSVVQERTLLGRVRILATSRDGRREIILNPRTGEILRDLWLPTAGATSQPRIIDDRPSASDDDDDDDDDDGGRREEANVAVLHRDVLLYGA